MAEQKYSNYVITLAALLHDLGKLKWRASDSVATENIGKQSIEIFEEYIAGKSCVTPFVAQIKELLNNDGLKILSLINLADKMDAESGYEKLDPAVRTQPLESILSKVRLTKSNPSTYSYYPPKPLNYQAIFPDTIVSHNALEVNSVAQGFKSIYHDFIKELQSLPGVDLKAYVDSLLYLFEKYLVYVPAAAYFSVPDISLFDHSKTVAVLTTCLNATENNEKPFLIVAADISGIQSFIYSDAVVQNADTGGRAKRLRGKSFYVALLTDLFASLLCERFDVSRANILINGGGHFIVLLPNSEKTKVKLNNFKKELQQWFLEAFNAEILLVLETLEADASLYKNYSLWHDQISQLLVVAKKKKLVDILSNVFSESMEEPDANEFFTKLEQSDIAVFQELSAFEKLLMMQNRLFEHIGEAIPRSEYFVEIIGDFNKRDRFENRIIPFKRFKRNYVFVNNIDSLETLLSEIKPTDQLVVRVQKINDSSLLLGLPTKDLQYFSSRQFPLSLGFRFIGRATPFDETGKNVETFESLAFMNNENPEQPEKLNYDLLGILRMDVDNLGSIFSFGFKEVENRQGKKESIESLARVVNLSRDMNLFFQGYLNQIAEKRNIYITYSGGDDLFVVGSWINTIHFALDVKKEFSKFSGSNANVGISGGIYFSKPGFPIGKSALLAGENEKKAKQVTEKNSIYVFDRAVDWNNLEEQINFGKQLFELTDSETPKDEKINPSYIHFLLTLTTQINQYSETESFEDRYFKVMPRLKYSLSRSPRNISKQAIEKNVGAKNRKVALLSKLVIDADYKNTIKNFIIPASYVILKNREKK